MVYKTNLRPAWVVMVLVLLSALAFTWLKTSDSAPLETSTAEEIKPVKVDLSKFTNAEENEKCFRCHGQTKYSYMTSDSSKTVTKRMYTELVMDRDIFYVSNHREFKCTDCHSEDYGTFPHPNELRMEAIATCIDCHGGDEKYAKFQFEKIESEFLASAHSEKHSEDFTCWMCHDAHEYRINARTNENLKETITYDNMICLNCHGDVRNYQLLTTKAKPNILQKHEWLPNQVSHFTNVRCIECHTRNNDTLEVAHHVVPKEEAVRKCESCHSKNSILYASLYKYQVSEKIEKEGLVKGLLLGDTTTIGPDKNNTLNIISLVIFGMTLLFIIIHAAFRMKK